MERGRIQRLPIFLVGVPPIISGAGKATDFKFGWYIYSENPNKSLLKILEKRERGRIQEVPKFFGYPSLSQERIKLRTSNFVGTFIGSIRKKLMKMLGIVAMGIVRESQKFSGHPYLGCIARSSLRQHSFLVLCFITSFVLLVIAPLLSVAVKSKGMYNCS